MSRKNAGSVFALCLLMAGSVGADDDAKNNCIAAWVASCSRDCATPKCVSTCTSQAHQMCAQNVVAPQSVFNGPVVSTPTTQCVAQDRPFCAPPPAITVSDSAAAVVGSTCSIVSGTVTTPAFFGGQVIIYVVCPPGAPVGSGSQATTTTIVGSGQSDCATGKFSFTASNACGGQSTGCYGLIAATPPSSCEACGTCGAPASPPGDPGWNTCTGDVCPAP
jgi:hypothetical protein